VLIATPGRLLDHVERGGVLLRGVEVLVIDEADRMLDMGFIPDIEKIVGMIPFTRQTLFFSATMPPEITRLSEQFLSAPKRIEVARPSSTNDNVSQKLIEVAPMKKREALRDLFDKEDVTNGIIFCNRKRDIGELLKSLHRHDYKAVSLHGDMDQHMRLKMLDQFKSGDATYLIASDVAARGLDIPAVSHVFNFDVPTHAEDYVHRIGRTGRAGRSGAAFTLATRNDGKYVDAIEQLIEQKIEREAFSGGDSGEGSDDKPRKNNRRNNRGSKSDGKGRSEKSETGQEAKANGAGKRRGLLGRNRRGGKAENNKSQEAKAETPRETRAKETKAKENKPQNSGGKKPNKKGDAFEGNMPDFLK
jgi:superfamily II DNA/RNA helicase